MTRYQRLRSTQRRERNCARARSYGRYLASIGWTNLDQIPRPTAVDPYDNRVPMWETARLGLTPAMWGVSVRRGIVGPDTGIDQPQLPMEDI